jgi:DNA repair exonuclease SbcCD ATPase subunit
MDDDFSPEEIRLEKEVEQALTELEAADATVTALRMQLENAMEDVATTRRELSQLRGVVDDWEKATEEGRRELTERERRVEELLAALPPELQAAGMDLGCSPGAANDGGAEEEGLCEDIKLSPRRRRLDLTTDRVRVLAGQTARLEEQVLQRQFAAEASMSERRKLEQQAEALERERDSLRGGLREARGEVRELEIRLKRRDEVLVATAQRRQTLERQQAQSRSEVNGLQARLAALATPKATTEAAASARATPSATPRAANAATTSTPPPATPVAAQENSIPLALPGEDARAVSLRLQREIVDLWSQLRHCDEVAEKTLPAAKGGAPEQGATSDAVRECAVAGG